MKGNMNKNIAIKRIIGVTAVISWFSGICTYGRNNDHRKVSSHHVPLAIITIGTVVRYYRAKYPAV